MSGGEEEIDEEEEARSVFGSENRRVHQQRVQFLVEVGILQVVSVDEYEDAVERENADDASHVVRLDEKVGESEGRRHERHHVIGQEDERLLEDGGRKRRLKELRPQIGE